METAVVIEISVAFLIGTITTIWRSIIAGKSPKGLLADDRLAVVACIVWWASSGIFAFGGYEFPITNANVSDDDREHLRPGGDRPDFAKNVMIGSFIIFVGLEFGILFIWTLKLSVLFYFARLMGHVDTMRRHLEVATILWATTFMTMVLYQHLRCVPIERNWQIYPDPGSKSSPLPVPLFEDGWSQRARTRPWDETQPALLDLRREQRCIKLTWRQMLANLPPPSSTSTSPLFPTASWTWSSSSSPWTSSAGLARA